MTDSALVCIGPITAAMANSLGYTPAAMGRVYTIPGLIDALVELLGAREAVR
jgi:uroporphyrinogen-III synthase